MPTETKSAQPVFWESPVPLKDDFGRPITSEFYDARTTRGSWATMNPQSFALHAATMTLGRGRGQRFVKQPGGRWLKAEG